MPRNEENRHSTSVVLKGNLASASDAADCWAEGCCPAIARCNQVEWVCIIYAFGNNCFMMGIVGYAKSFQIFFFR